MCLKIKEEQVEKIFELVVDKSTGRSELLTLLKAIAKVNKVSILPTANNYAAMFPVSLPMITCGGQ